MTKSLACVLFAVINTVFAGCAESPAAPPGAPVARRVSASSGAGAAQNEVIAQIRQSTSRYHSVEAAIADGYGVASPCEAVAGGGIGLHYRKASLFDMTVDVSQPELLVYEPQKGGKLRLVAVAFVVPAIPWDASHSAPPMLGEQVFEDKRVPDWSSPPFPTYELHVWVWQHNPEGMYATTNPTISCEYAR